MMTDSRMYVVVVASAIFMAVVSHNAMYTAYALLGVAATVVGGIMLYLAPKIVKDSLLRGSFFVFPWLLFSTQLFENKSTARVGGFLFSLFIIVILVLHIVLWYLENKYERKT